MIPRGSIRITAAAGFVRAAFLCSRELLRSGESDSGAGNEGWLDACLDASMPARWHAGTGWSRGRGPLI